MNAREPDAIHTLSEAHRANLEKLALFLIANAQILHFEMRLFQAPLEAYEERLAVAEDDDSDAFYELENDALDPQNARREVCGTVACAAGSGPLAGIPIEPTDATWDGYIDRVFGLAFASRAWAWCFSGDWARADNTAEGAGKRILYMLEHGVPENSIEQQLGTAPLSYLSTLCRRTKEV